MPNLMIRASISKQWSHRESGKLIWNFVNEYLFTFSYSEIYLRIPKSFFPFCYGAPDYCDHPIEAISGANEAYNVIIGLCSVSFSWITGSNIIEVAEDT